MNCLFSPDDELVRRIHDQLAHLAMINREMPHATRSVQLLTPEQLSQFIESAFWASLRPNEGRATRVCITIGTPEKFQDAISFATPLPCDEAQIVKLAPAAPPRV
jgi:hypothetical protein